MVVATKDLRALSPHGLAALVARCARLSLPHLNWFEIDKRDWLALARAGEAAERFACGDRIADISALVQRSADAFETIRRKTKLKSAVLAAETAWRTMLLVENLAVATKKKDALATAKKVLCSCEEAAALERLDLKTTIRHDFEWLRDHASDQKPVPPEFFA